MISTKQKIWYSFFDRGEYKGDEPFFFETQNYPWIKLLENNYALIKKELEELLKNDLAFQAYFNSSIVNSPLSWKTFSFSWWDVQLYKNKKKCPATNKMLDAIPNLVSASFNFLETGASILPHCGDTNGIYRCHLGLIIPDGLPDCGFKVGEESRAWNEGKILVFCDANKHTAWNNTDKPRFILLFDIIREDFLSQKKFICANVLGSLFLQKLGLRFPFLEKTPQKIQFAMHYVVKLNILWYVPFRNFITKFWLLFTP